jgi:nitrite reductase (NADH) small subunit
MMTNSTALSETRIGTDRANWYTVCKESELNPFMGVRALLHGKQIALFMIRNSREIFAIDAIDPFSGAAVLSRGIVGDLKGELVVASPIYKQHFNLRTGVCLEDETCGVETYPVRVRDGYVQVADSDTRESSE